MILLQFQFPLYTTNGRKLAPYWVPSTAESAGPRTNMYNNISSNFIRCCISFASSDFGVMMGPETEQVRRGGRGEDQMTYDYFVQRKYKVRFLITRGGTKTTSEQVYKQMTLDCTVLRYKPGIELYKQRQKVLRYAQFLT